MKDFNQFFVIYAGRPSMMLSCGVSVLNLVTNRVGMIISPGAFDWRGRGEVTQL